jgi:Ca-activated chloride channel family protein
LSFIWPAALVALVLVPLAALAYLFAERRRRRAAGRFGNAALVAGLTESPSARRRHLPYVFALAALTLLLLGVARPQASVSVPREEATVMLALDVSGSMAADDVVPSRLGAAQAAARAFLEQVPPRFRVGIVAFSDSATVVLPPTTDRTAAGLALDNLRIGGGTAIGGAISRALAVVRPATSNGARPAAPLPPATIVLLSDGAQTAGMPALGAAQVAKRAGVPVNTVTLGTQAAIVHVPLPGGLQEQVVVTPDPATLRAVAQATGGSFSAAPGAAALRKVYERLGSRIGHVDKRTELTAVFAGVGALVLLAASGTSLLWFRRAL